MAVYLDNNASAPVRPEAISAMIEVLSGNCGNPSAIHASGRAAHRLLEDARTFVAQELNMPSARLVFTGGGSEAIALGVLSVADAVPNGEFVVSSIEHEAMRRSVEESGRPSHVLPVDGDGVLCLDALRAALGDVQDRGATPLVAVMSASNITGVRQPLDRLSELVQAAGGYLLVDAIQSLGKETIDFGALAADVVCVSGHKFGAPQGIGALATSDRVRPVARVWGGGQERGFRAGTQGVALVAAMRAALEAAIERRNEESIRVSQFRSRFEAALRALRDDVDVLGADASRMGHVSAFSLPGRTGQQVTIALDLAGVEVSAGSACTSGKLTPNQVATAMGRTEATARGLVRVSFGWKNTQQDLDKAITALGRVIAPHTAPVA